MVWMLRASLESGDINGDQYGCAEQMKLLDKDLSLIGLPIGSMEYNGAVTAFGYNDGTADASTIYCALPHDDKGKVMSVPQEIAIPGSQHIRQAEMLNLNGQQVASWTIPAGQSRVDWQQQGLSAGLYLLRIHGPDHAMSSRKVMVHP